MTIQMKAIEQYFHVVLLIMPYKLVLILNKSYSALCSYGNVYHAVQDSLFLLGKLVCEATQMKSNDSTIRVELAIRTNKLVLILT